MTDGIYYEHLMDIASINEKIALCPSSMRAELAYAVKHCPESEVGELVSSCVDIPKSVRDNDGARIIMSLIDRYIQSLGMSSLRDGMRAELEDSPLALLKFIRYPRGTRGSDPESQESRSIDAVMGLRYYQIVAVREVIGKLHAPGSRVMLHAPTGAGKTRMAMSIVATHFRIHGPTAVLWLASGSELIDQAASAFEETWKYHGDIKARLHLWRGDSQFEPEHEPKRNCMLVSGLQKVSRAWNSNKNLTLDLRQMVSLIVFDEAHQTTAESYQRLVEEVMEGEKCRLLGLSATPGRARDEESRELARIYSGTKVSVRSPDGRGVIGHLIHKGYLAEAKFHVIMEEDLYEEDGKQKFPMGESGRDFLRNKRIVGVVEGAIRKGHKRIIVFSPSVDSAHMCAAMLKSFGGIKNSNAIDASTPKEKRDEITKRYSISDDKDIHIIFNCGVLTQGFDAPCTSAVVIARPTESVGLYSQMVGRAIRGLESKGNRHADIYTVVGTERSEFRDIAAAFERWNNLWENPNNDQN